MTSVTVALKGGDQAIAALHGLPASLDSLDVDGVGRVVVPVVARIAPRRTGYLAEHVTAKQTGTGWPIVSGAPYTRFTITRRNPWPARALDAVADEVSDLYRRAVGDVLDKAAN